MYLDAGIPAINAVVAAFALYAVVGRMLGARHRDPARKTPFPTRLRDKDRRQKCYPW